jgi:toxin ParE1/3/4
MGTSRGATEGKEMIWSVVLRAEAYDDLESAVSWYEQKSRGLGDRFTDAVRKLKMRIAGNPYFYGEAGKKVRAGKLDKFPYVVYYLLETDRVVIIGILHGRRSPRVWQRRIS